MRTCKWCNKIFDELSGRIFSNHVRWCDSNPNRNKFKRRTKEPSLFLRKCKVCGNIFEVPTKQHRKKCCSPRCSSELSRSFAENIHKSSTFSEKMSKIAKRMWRNETYIEKQLSREDFYTSAGEVEIRRHFQENFFEDDWTYGGRLIFNNLPIIRDLYSNKLKVCIEYDGIWHFDNIKGQLKDKILKDNNLFDWCQENEFRLIRIDEDVYLEDKDYWLIQIQKEVYFGTQSFVLFWDLKNSIKRSSFISQTNMNQIQL